MKGFAQRVKEAAQAVSSHVAEASIGTKTDPATWRFDWDGSETQADRDAVAAWLATVDPASFEDAANETTELRAEADAIMQTGTEAQAKLFRAVASVLVDELNSIRQWITSFKAATAAATSLNDFKTRVAALGNMPDRTLAQAKTAITNTLNSGTVD